MNRQFCFLTVLLLLALGAQPQRGPTVNPVEVLQHHLSHGIGDSPLDSPLASDAVNAAILVAAHAGVTREQLAAAVPRANDLDQRLEALVRAGLLIRQAELVRAAFPIVMDETRQRYQQLVTRAVPAIHQELRPHIAALKQSLARRGWGEWAYHFVWSQVFDSQYLWAELTERKLVPPLAPAITWVVYPQHPFKSGTNYYPDDELADPMLAVTWTLGGANTTGLVGGQWRTVYAAALAGRSADPAAAEELRALGLLTDGGRLRIPVVQKGDELDRQLRGIASLYLRLMQQHLPVTEIAKVVGAERGFALAMAHHDLCWELLRRMVNRGELTRPAALRGQSQGAAPPSMTGVCAVVPADPGFVAQLKKALEQ